MIDFAFCGMKGLGGAVMRGESVAKKLGVPFLDVRNAKNLPKMRTAYLVKYAPDNAVVVRKACDRFIWEPLDVFSSWRAFSDSPAAFWLWCHRRLGFDEIVASSPSCAVTMGTLGVPVHLLPHHADPRCSEDWYDPNGHVAYAGGRQYVSPALESIESACRRIGRRFVGDFSRQPLGALQDAALHLHLRYPPHDSELNRLAKPQVKAENAAACGAKMLASNHPCVTSLRPEIPVIGGDETIECAILRAIESEPLSSPVTLEQHCQRLLPILSGRKCPPI